MNKKYVYMLCLAWVTALALTSCLQDNESTDLSGYDDMAVATFSISSVNRVFHKTTSSGKDSTYQITVNSSLPVFTIDQYKQEIYNTTPLPSECDLKHVLATITAKNSGTIVLKSATSDSLYFYSSTDSIDFSQPRELRVYAANGSGFRAYTVDVRMSETKSNTMQWQQMPAGTAMPVTPTAGWDFKINSTGDGINASNDQWATQMTETLDTDAALLPQVNASFACWQQSDGTSYALLVGDNDYQENAAVTWRKVISTDIVSSWVFMPLNAQNPYYLPKGHYYWLLPYTDNSVLAIDANGNIYQSRDQGITWKKTSLLKSPVSSIAQAATDGEGGIWLKDGETGDIWCGKMDD
jgi:hypothetical protein